MSLAPTPSQTIGPFFGVLMPLGSNELVSPDSPEAIRIEGTVLDGDQCPVGDALIEIWQADGGGRYAPDAGAFPGFGRALTDPEGRFAFWTVKPGRRQGEESLAPSVEVIIFARGLLRHLRTRIYFPDEVEANRHDPVLAAVQPDRRPTLMAAQSEPGVLQFPIRLQGQSETVFFEP